MLRSFATQAAFVLHAIALTIAIAAASNSVASQSMARLSSSGPIFAPRPAPVRSFNLDLWKKRESKRRTPNSAAN